jgi:hypothetical protein
VPSSTTPLTICSRPLLSCVSWRAASTRCC